jgi:hypothetical protein
VLDELARDGRRTSVHVDVGPAQTEHLASATTGVREHVSDAGRKVAVRGHVGEELAHLLGRPPGVPLVRPAT